MSLHDATRRSLRRSIELTRDFVAVVPESALSSELPGLPSNAVGEQLWCVIGARESYARAIRAGEWKGFSCSVSSAQSRSKNDLERALARSGTEALQVLEELESFSEEQNRLALDLVEHEAAHQGQLIRYLYALRLDIPESWKKRYALK